MSPSRSLPKHSRCSSKLSGSGGRDRGGRRRRTPSEERGRNRLRGKTRSPRRRSTRSPQEPKRRSRSPRQASGEVITPVTKAASRGSSSQRRNILHSSLQPRGMRRRSLSPGSVRSHRNRPTREETPTALLAISSSSSSSTSSPSSSSSSKQKDESVALERSTTKSTCRHGGRSISRSREPDGREGSRDSVVKCEKEKSGERGTFEDRDHRKDGGGASSPRDAVRKRDQGWRGGESKTSNTNEVATTIANYTSSVESGDRQGRERNERAQGRGRRSGGGNASNTDGERGLRRDGGASRSSMERLLPPEAFQHNRDDRKRDSPSVRMVSNSPPPQKRARSRERSQERKRPRHEGTHKNMKGETLSNVTLQGENEHSSEPSRDPAPIRDEKKSNKDFSDSLGADMDVSIDAEVEEVFSDFGESDEEILTKEGVIDPDNEVLVGCGDTRTTNRSDSRTSSQKSAKDNADVFYISGDLDEVSQVEDGEKDDRRDALEVDWSELMAKPTSSADKRDLLRSRDCCLNLLSTSRDTRGEQAFFR